MEAAAAAARVTSLEHSYHLLKIFTVPLKSFERESYGLEQHLEVILSASLSRVVLFFFCCQQEGGSSVSSCCLVADALRSPGWCECVCACACALLCACACLCLCLFLDVCVAYLCAFCIFMWPLMCFCMTV